MKPQKKAIEDVVSEAMQHIQKIEYEDDGEDLSDVKLYYDVEDSAHYIHNLRRERAK